MIGWCRCRWEMVIGDFRGWPEATVLLSFTFLAANMSFIAEVRVTGGLGGNCVVFIDFFSMSICHSFQQ